MAILNITWNGISAEARVAIDHDLGDADLKRVAVELIRSGEVPGLHIASLPERSFDHFVVDRFDTPEGGKRIFLRPKVPFGSAAPGPTRAGT